MFLFYHFVRSFSSPANCHICRKASHRRSEKYIGEYFTFQLRGVRCTLAWDLFEIVTIAIQKSYFLIKGVVEGGFGRVVHGIKSQPVAFKPPSSHQASHSDHFVNKRAQVLRCRRWKMELARVSYGSCWKGKNSPNVRWSFSIGHLKWPLLWSE